LTRLVLIIDADLYAVQRVWPEADAFKLAWSMLREGSDTRTVMLKDGVIACDCPSQTMQMGPKGLECKHISSLRDVGLLPRNP